MSDRRRALELECAALTRYLARIDATPYVMARYVAAHSSLESLTSESMFDAMLVRMACGPAILRWPATAFARLQARSSLLQAKLVLLLAILETAPPSSRIFDVPPIRSPLWLTMALVLRASVATLALLIGAAVLTPVRWVREKGRAGR